MKTNMDWLKRAALALVVGLALVTANPVAAQTSPQTSTLVPRGGTAFHCVLTATATTSTQVTGCEVVAGKRYFITSISGSQEAVSVAANPFIIQSGTSTACTGPRVLASVYLPTALTSFHRLYPVPIPVTVSEGLCMLNATTGTKKVEITGYYR